MSAQHTPGPWEVKAVGQHYIVTRFCPAGSRERPNGGAEYLSQTGRRTAKFRSQDAAERAAIVAIYLGAYLQAMQTAPECADGHGVYYVAQLRRSGLTERAARAAITKATGASNA